MSAIDRGIGGEFRKLLQALRHFLPTASLEVCTSDTHTEKGVTREGDMLVSTLVDTSPWRVPGSMQDVEMMSAEMDLLPFSEIVTDGSLLFVEVKTKQV